MLKFLLLSLYTLVLASRLDYRHKIVLIFLSIYCLYQHLSYMTLSTYLLFSGAVIIAPVFCIYSKEFKWDWIFLLNYLMVVPIKVVEILFIIDPFKFFIPLFESFYANLDVWFVAGTTSCFLLKELGFTGSPFKHEPSFRRYLLSVLVSYTFTYFILD